MKMNEDEIIDFYYWFQENKRNTFRTYLEEFRKWQKN